MATTNRPDIPVGESGGRLCGRPKNLNGPGTRTRKKTEGIFCSQKAGHGTDHVGFGPCKYHGGNTRSGKIAAAKEKLEYDLITTVGGVPQNVTPAQALLHCVHVAAGEVVWIQHRISKLTAADELYDSEYGKQLNVWLKERQQAVDRLARYSKMALDTGVAALEVAAANRIVDILAQFTESIQDGLQLTPQQQKMLPILIQTAVSQLEPTPGRLTENTP